MSIRACVIGATGYTGCELVRLCAGHEYVELIGLYASEKRMEPISVHRIDASLRDVVQGRIEPLEVSQVLALKPDVVFLATPHEASMDLAARLIENGLRVVDLSGAYRLGEADDYPEWYAFEHAHGDLLKQAVYGLPEINRQDIGDAQLVAVPGCYPTAAVLSLAPLVKEGMIREGSKAIIDAISGVSGAGRTPSSRTHICESGLGAYGVFGHRHTPEIQQHSGMSVIFTPHLGAFDRGIHETIHVELASGVSEGDVRAVFVKWYSDEPFVRLMEAGEWPSTRSVARTNFCDIGIGVCETNGHVIVCSTIDNLMKGASGQAVQCMNLMFKLPETTGLGAREVGARSVMEALP